MSKIEWHIPDLVTCRAVRGDRLAEIDWFPFRHKSQRYLLSLVTRVDGCEQMQFQYHYADFESAQARAEAFLLEVEVDHVDT